VAAIRNQLIAFGLDALGSKKEVRIRLLVYYSKLKIAEFRDLCGISDTPTGYGTRMVTVQNLTAKLVAEGLRKVGTKDELKARLLFHYSKMSTQDLIACHKPCGAQYDEMFAWLISVNERQLDPLSVPATYVKLETVAKSSVKISYRIAISKKRRMEVWNHWIGEEHGCTNCPLCLKVKIQQGGSEWHTSHVVSHNDGGTIEVQNLRVICGGCNGAMGSYSMLEYCKFAEPTAIGRLAL
jgi:hypothetical protein